MSRYKPAESEAHRPSSSVLRRFGWAALIASVLAACGDSAPVTTVEPDPGTTVPATVADTTTTVTETVPVAADPKTYVVGVDGSAPDFNGMFLGFFPHTLTVHPGDTVVFRGTDNGEPHTVTFVDGLVAAPTPGSAFFEGGFGGPPRRDASMPCVLDEGRPPPEGCAPEHQEMVPFDGTHSWYNSGGLLDGEGFVLQLADDIAPGTYSFLCLVHRDEMRGTIEVVAAGEDADDPADVMARGAEELEHQVQRTREWVEASMADPPGRVLADRNTTDFKSWAILFRPADIEIPVGGTVRWVGIHVHTVSFNAPESARPYFERAADGSVRENEVAVQPVGDPAGWDGVGFFNSGPVLFDGRSFSMTFTRPGTYSYLCLVHFDMEGRVTVVE
jgi:plastocyanin